MFIAKMHTRYPDYHGKGYYNFLMADTEDELINKVSENSHDFSYESKVELDGFENIDELMQKYPTKESLNKGVFSV